MSWCKVSSLNASVAKALKGFSFPVSRRKVLTRTRGIVVEGWEVGYFLKQALSNAQYFGLREIMADVESWADGQG